jgi:anti-anti-sigma regulatory factor
MKVSRSDHKTLSVLTVTGAIDHTATGELQADLLTAVNDTGVDVVLDARGVVAFDDAALVALTAARSRAKHLRRRIVVVDREGGAVVASLRRSGLYYRFPVHPDVAAAARGLVAERAARSRIALGRILGVDVPGAG